MKTNYYIYWQPVYTPNGAVAPTYCSIFSGETAQAAKAAFDTNMKSQHLGGMYAIVRIVRRQ